MAEEYQQPQLHRPHEAEEEGDKRQYHDESKNTNTNVFASSGDEVANTNEGSKDREFFENKVGDEADQTEPMKFDTSDDVVGDGSAVEATERGLFGSFMGKKEKEVKKVDENEVDKVATDIEKVLVSEETKVEEEEKGKKLSRSGSSSSSSSIDEEENGEDGEKKKKKKGPEEKIKEMVSGEEDKTEEVEKNDILEKEVEKPENNMLDFFFEKPENNMLDKEVEKPKNNMLEKEVEKPENNMLEKEVEKPENNMLDKEVEKPENNMLDKEVEKPENNMLEKEVKAPNEKPQKVAYEESFEEASAEPAADQAELDNGVMDKTTNTEDSPAPKINTQEQEEKEKKGILEKIKEKIPGLNAKTT